jgi:hypothetical protein
LPSAEGSAISLSTMPISASMVAISLSNEAAARRMCLA